MLSQSLQVPYATMVSDRPKSRHPLSGPHHLEVNTEELHQIMEKELCGDDMPESCDPNERSGKTNI